MKKNIQSLRFLALLAISALSCQVSTTQAQDSLYIYKAGVVTRHAVIEIDSMSFTAPVYAPVAKASECGAYLGAGNTLYKQFLCRNLGAAGDLYSIADALAYNAADDGDLYQWGRPTDGHEKRSSLTTTTLATTNTPGAVGFITTNNWPNDWRSGGGNADRWTDATKAANDPCPAGYKVPSQAQWAAVVDNNTRGTWASGFTFGDNLFLPASGYRYNSDGSLSDVGGSGGYWSSTVTGDNTYFLQFSFFEMMPGMIDENLNASGVSPRTFGWSVRCIAE